MRWMMLVALVGLAGCEVAEAAADGYGIGESKSGTRLRYTGRVLRGDDGSALEIPGGFHDSLLGVDCAPGLAQDRATRCLPTVPVLKVPDDEFADSSCLTPAVMFPSVVSGCSDSKYPAIARLPSGESCEPPRFVRIDTGSAGIATWRFIDGECTGVTAPPNTWVFPLLDEIDPEEFVAFE